MKYFYHPGSKIQYRHFKVLGNDNFLDCVWIKTDRGWNKFTYIEKIRLHITKGMQAVPEKFFKKMLFVEML